MFRIVAGLFDCYSLFFGTLGGLFGHYVGPFPCIQLDLNTLV